MCEQIKIMIKTTLSESPWSNGLCKRQNQSLAFILLKKDTESDYEIALSWVLCAKNALINNSGFSLAN